METLLNPRQGMRQLTQGFPKPIDDLIQAWFTSLSGVPYLGQEPIVEVGALYYLGTGLLHLVGGTLGSIAIIELAPKFFLLLLLTAFWTTCGAWQLYGVVTHYCAHGKLTGNKMVDKLIGEFLSALCLTNPLQIYESEHAKDHHDLKNLTTLDDPDMLALIEWGFKPGQPKKYYWTLLKRLILSPRWHFAILVGRMKKNFLIKNKVSLSRRLGAALLWLILVLVVAQTHTWIGFLVAWIIPLTLLFQIALILEFISRHRWGLVQNPDMSVKLYYESKSFGRHLGKTPPFDKSLDCWILWGFEMLGYQILRSLVIPGDLTVHDWHHAHPMSLKWPMAIWHRQQEIEKGCPSRVEPFQGTWGLLNVIDEVFETLSDAPVLP
jgi:hypothetical protein